MTTRGLAATFFDVRHPNVHFIRGVSMSRIARWSCSTFAFAMLITSSTLAQDRNRPLRVGNTNLLAVGLGYIDFEHPNYSADGFPNVGYQRRILRREMRRVPIWARAAANFTSHDRNTANAFTVWPSNLPSGTVPFPEQLLAERTSDFTVRAELLADVLHGPHFAVYGGAGFALHYLSFSTRGCAPRASLCSSNTFRTNDNRVGPSMTAGVRAFSATRPYTAYGEVRFGTAYGKIDVPPSRQPLTNESFEFTDSSAVSFEAGVGVHW